jgi:hypothetical protein
MDRLWHHDAFGQLGQQAELADARQPDQRAAIPTFATGTAKRRFSGSGAV